MTVSHHWRLLHDALEPSYILSPLMPIRMRGVRTMSTRQLPIHNLPLAPDPLQRCLPRLPLEPQPSAQRRSTTFKTSTPGIWARVAPLWTAWPLRVTKEEVEAMGVDLENGGQVSVEDVLARWDPNEVLSTGPNGLQARSSAHRLKIKPELLGISQKALDDRLPHLDVGDAVDLCRGTAGSGSEARDALVDVLSGRHVLMSEDQGDAAYGPWSTRYCGHQFGSWAGQLGDGRAISLIETQLPDGRRTEIQLKGAGRTPFSRSADGLAVLRSGVREFLGCEGRVGVKESSADGAAVASLGIPTTRSLALLTVPIEDLPVIRENGPEPTSLTARLAPSFIRIGHFEALNPSESARGFSQIFLGGGGWLKDDTEKEGPLDGQGNLESLRELAEWCKRVMGYEGSTEGWVREVVRRNAEMVAGWQVSFGLLQLTHCVSPGTMSRNRACHFLKSKGSGRVEHGRWG
jgi:hypothetical protein